MICLCVSNINNGVVLAFVLRLKTRQNAQTIISSNLETIITETCKRTEYRNRIYGEDGEGRGLICPGANMVGGRGWQGRGILHMKTLKSSQNNTDRLAMTICAFAIGPTCICLYSMVCPFHLTQIDRDRSCDTNERSVGEFIAYGIHISTNTHKLLLSDHSIDKAKANFA